eukprot:3088542-Amphidinium_carterae.1
MHATALLLDHFHLWEWSPRYAPQPSGTAQGPHCSPDPQAAGAAQGPHSMVAVLCNSSAATLCLTDRRSSRPPFCGEKAAGAASRPR